jgi:hypothetical protein
MSKVIKLDECYSVSTERDSVILRYECVTDKISPKSGKPEVTRDTWHYPNLSLALKKYFSMNISLENWLRNKLHEVERMQDYSVATDTIRAWIDLYNELKIKEDEIK